MAIPDDIPGNLLRKPSGKADAQNPQNALERALSNYKSLHTYRLDKEKSYKQQYADMYFLRLTKIKPAVEQLASSAWQDTVIGDEPAKRVDRVLDIRQGELCWVIGTVYMDMPLKPNILEDVSKDRWISAPISDKKYYSDGDAVTLEDESGRIRLVGDVLKSVVLVTGCIIAVMGTENVNGELEVIDLKFPDLAPQPDRWALTKPSKTQPRDEDVEMNGNTRSSNSKIAIVSGLSFSATDASHSLELNLLLEYLLGETLDPASQQEVALISRLIIAGNSISTDERRHAEEEATQRTDSSGAKKLNSQKKYGYDSSTYNAQPSQLLDEFLSTLLPTIPVTMMPGAQDPANASYPQQPVHPAMFPNSRAYTATPSATTSASEEPGWFDSVTNPWEGEIDGWRVLGTGGQNVDDVWKYVDSDDRLGMMEAMCRWRCSAPTAPDTLWAYPFQDNDPFVMRNCPHLFFVGNQPQFGTKVITGGTDGQTVRLVAVPSFSATGEIVLVDTETLDVSRVRIMGA